MGRTSNGARCNVDLAGISLGISDELGDRLGRNRWMHQHDVGHDNDAGDRRDIADETEIKLFVERSIDGVYRSDEEERVAIRGSPHDRLRGDISPGARPVLDDKLLPKSLREPLTDQASDDVNAAAGWNADDNAHRPRWIGLRESNARHDGERGSSRCEMEKISAGKFHLNLPLEPSVNHVVGAAAYFNTLPPGRRTVKTEPLPGSLVTITSPPIMRASLRVMARPSPVPPNFCAVVASAWLNSSNNFACCSAVMPMPVSATASSIQSRPLATLRARSLTSPSLVNLQALLRKLSSICRSRMVSTINAPRFSWASTTRRFLFCSASCPEVPMTSLISGANCTVCGFSSSFPASIFERSSTWLMRPSRCVPARFTRCSGSCAFSVPKRAALVTLAVPWRLHVDRSTRISCSRSLPTSKSTGRPRLKRCVSNSLRRT